MVEHGYIGIPKKWPVPIFPDFSGVLAERKVNLWDHMGTILPKRLQATYSISNRPLNPETKYC